MKTTDKNQKPTAVSSVHPTTEKIISQLIASNNDRYESYVNSAKEMNEPLLKDMFVRLSIQSRKFIQSLKQIVSFSNVQQEETLSENIFRGCAYTRPSLRVNDTSRLLSCCEYAELMTLQNYAAAASNPVLPKNVRKVLHEHMMHLAATIHDLQSVNSGGVN